MRKKFISKNYKNNHTALFKRLREPATPLTAGTKTEMRNRPLREAKLQTNGLTTRAGQTIPISIRLE